MFNTLRYAKMLEEVGFSRDQAETSVKILVEIMEDKLASKHDLQELRVATQHDLQELRVATQHDLQELRVATQHDLQELRVATQHDIQELRVATQHDFQELRAEMDHRFTKVDTQFALLESRLTVKLGTMLAASIAILTAIQKLT